MTDAERRELLLKAGIRLPSEVRMLATVLPGELAPKKPSKYGNKKHVYNRVTYDSKAEADRAKLLDEHAREGIIYWWIRQPTFRLGCHENVYRPDFLVVSSAGTRVEDVKGMETAKFKKDRRLWESYGPTDLWIIKGKKIEIIEGRNGE